MKNDLVVHLTQICVEASNQVRKKKWCMNSQIFKLLDLTYS